MANYDFKAIEKKWQDRWEKEGAFNAVDDFSLPKFYGLVEFPFTAAASMADIVLLKRLDAVSAAAWTLCAAMRTALLVFCAWKALLVPFSAMKSTEKRKQYET